jgi:hypothetical protein
LKRHMGPEHVALEAMSREHPTGSKSTTGARSMSPSRCCAASSTTSMSARSRPWC